jgi:K+-transporting ATPase c subunit
MRVASGKLRFARARYLPPPEKFRDEHFFHTRASRTHVCEYQKYTSATVKGSPPSTMWLFRRQTPRETHETIELNLRAN